MAEGPGSTAGSRPATAEIAPPPDTGGTGGVLTTLDASQAETCDEEAFVVVIHTREQLSRWLGDPRIGAELLRVESLIGDPEAWAEAAQGAVPIPLDVVIDDPGAEFAALYRLVDVRLARPVRVTLPARSGLMKALRLAASIQLPVRILPGQPNDDELAELLEAVDFYLHDPMVDAPVDFFHSLLAVFSGTHGGTIWHFLEEDPAIFPVLDENGQPRLPVGFVSDRLAEMVETGGECAECRFREVCAGYFKHPDPCFDCTGVKQLLAKLAAAAAEIADDLAGLAR